MQYLPNPDEREWLIRYLRKLIERAGWKHFVSAPILEPMRTWFPEKWSGSVRDAHIVTQRLMHYAGLERVRVTLEGFESFEDDDEHFDTAAYFVEIKDGRAHFGVKHDILDDPEKAAGTMAHEVAHAWRAQHKYVVEESRDREELLTDVTTIYLGFGIFTANNSDRFRTEGDMQVQRWSHSRVGYLPMQAMAFLLALQATARDDREETAKIERHLEPNQARAFREAMEYFAGEDVLALLSLPPRTTWPEIERAPHKYEVLAPDATEAREEEFEQEEQWNRGRYVYRVPKTPSFVTIAGIVVMAIGFSAFLQFGNERVVQVLVAWAAAMVMLIALGNHFRTFRCGDPECGGTIPPEANACPECGGSIAPTAEEALERNAAGFDFTDCSSCEPEAPCPRHA
jgi:hypothetical protein